MIDQFPTSYSPSDAIDMACLHGVCIPDLASGASLVPANSSSSEGAADKRSLRPMTQRRLPALWHIALTADYASIYLANQPVLRKEQSGLSCR